MPNNKAFIAEAKQALALWDGPFEGHYFLVRTAIEGYQYVHLRYGKAACKHLLADAQKHIAATPGAIVCEQVAQEAFSFLLYSEEPVTLDYLERMLGHRSEKFEAAHATYFSDCGTRMVFGVCAIKVGDVEEADVSARLACMDAHNARGRVRSFNLEAFNRAARERSREIELHFALESEHFGFFLQPKVNTRTGEIIGAEALARAFDESGNPICPADFLPIMEKNGSVVELDLLIFRKMCAYLSQRLAQDLPVVPTSVNLSRLHISDPQTPLKLNLIAAEYSIPTHLIEFELTETIFLDEFKGARRLIDQLRHAGYRVSIDDFGAGYAGMGVWQELDFDALKLDRSFFSENETLKEKNAAILPNVIDIAQRLHIDVICEGVETSQQCEALSELGCDLVQGYYYSKPLEPEEFYRIYTERQAHFAPAVSPLIKSHKHAEEPTPTNLRHKTKRATTALPRLVLVVALVFVCITALVFDTNRKITEAVFSKSVTSSMEGFAISHASVVNAKMDDVCSTLNAFSMLIENQESAEDARPYLDALDANRQNTLFYYSPIEELVAQNGANSAVIQRLKRIEEGQALVADVIIPFASNNTDRIAMGSPAFVNGEIKGVLWAVIDAEELISIDEYISPYGEIETVFMANQDGNILLETGEGVQEFNGETMNTLLNAGEGATTAHMGRVHGITHYISVAPISYNGWRVGFVFNAGKADAIAGHTMTTAALCTAIISLLVAACAALILFYLRKRRAAERIEQQRYQLLENFSDTVMFEYDPVTDTMNFTPNAVELVRLDPENDAHFAASIEADANIHPADRPLVKNILLGVERANPPEARIRVKGPHGEEFRWVLVQYRYLEVDGVLTSVIGKISDIDAQHRELERISHMARRDGLTGLYNKATSEKLIKQYVAEDTTGVLYVIDLDNFKHINDTLGHAAGDAALKTIARCLMDTFHKSDVIGRMGGDEFMVYLRGSLTQHAAMRIIEDFWEALRERTDETEIPLSMSVGAAILQANETFDSLYQRSDLELYRAKRNGRQRLSINGRIFALETHEEESPHDTL